MKSLFRVVALLLTSVTALPACAQTDTRPTLDVEPMAALEDSELLMGVWNAKGDDLSAFNDDFLAAVPPKQLKSIIADAHDRYGEARSVEPGRNARRWNLLTDDHQVPIDLVRDASGLIAGLLMKTPVARDTDLSSALQALKAEEATSSWLLMKDGERVDSEAPDELLMVGSAFKLHVLDAFREAVALGHLSREDVVTLEKRHRSWPSGILQDWSGGTPLTLGTAAQLMIALSDNTATDLMIDVLGREAIEEVSPYRPLMTTGDLFRLKRDPAREQRFGSGKEDERRQILAEIADESLPPIDAIPPAPLAGNEWYTSVEELCAVMERVAAEPEFQVNPGLASDDEWTSVAYKGGSEIGVLNMTYRLVGQDGTVWCLAATWNGKLVEGRPKALDAEARQSAIAGVIAAIGRGQD